MSDLEWPWEYNFPPFFTIQPHAKTREVQLNTWGDLLLKYHKNKGQSSLDLNTDSDLFCNTNINRKLPINGRLMILEELEKKEHAAPTDKRKTQWDIYWNTLDELSNLIYNWAIENGMANTVCTIFEICNGENSNGQEFYGLEQRIVVKALKILETKSKCELIMYDDNEGVKFF